MIVQRPVGPATVVDDGTALKGSVSTTTVASVPWIDENRSVPSAALATSSPARSTVRVTRIDILHLFEYPARGGWGWDQFSQIEFDRHSEIGTGDIMAVHIERSSIPNGSVEQSSSTARIEWKHQIRGQCVDPSTRFPTSQSCGLCLKNKKLCIYYNYSYKSILITPCIVFSNVRVRSTLRLLKKIYNLDFLGNNSKDMFRFL